MNVLGRDNRERCRCGHTLGDHGERSGLCHAEGCQCEVFWSEVDWLREQLRGAVKALEQIASGAVPHRDRSEEYEVQVSESIVAFAQASLDAVRGQSDA